MALSIGVFDGLHRGHQELLAGLASRAGALADLPVGVVTFDAHPRALLTPDRAPKTLMTVTRRLEILDSMGVDQVGVLPFAQVHHLPAEEFVRRVVINGFNARLVTIGHDFRYGAGRAGDVASLRESGERNGFTVEACELLPAGSVPISASMIRDRIARGDVATAAELLGRPHELEARHAAERRLASGHGAVTAELDFDPAMAVPAPGAYAVRIVIGADTYPGMCLIGSLGGPAGLPVPARAFVLDRKGEVQSGDTVAVRFVDRVRDPASGPDLRSRAPGVERDIDRVRRLLQR